MNETHHLLHMLVVANDVARCILKALRPSALVVDVVECPLVEALLLAAELGGRLHIKVSFIIIGDDTIVD